MTEEQLQAIRERAEKATKSPWEDDFGNFTDDGISVWSLGHVQGGEPVITTSGGVRLYEDAIFIAHARGDVPTLLAEVERLREINEELVSLALWSARRLKTPYYKLYSYEWLTKLTDKDMSEYVAEVHRHNAR